MSSEIETKQTQAQPIHLIRRLGAILYDVLLVVAVVFFAALIAAPLTSMVGLLDMENVGQAHPLAKLVYQLYLLGVIYIYYAWPWSHGGQTLGLRTWQAKLISTDDNPLTYKRLLIRFLMSWVSALCFGLGFLWSLFDEQKRTWHDRVSATALVKAPRKKKKKA